MTSTNFDLWRLGTSLRRENQIGSLKNVTPNAGI